MGMHLIYNHNGQSGEGYMALPETESGPAVIVIQEWWGLVGHIKDVVDRFAAAGFVAFAPDLYHGQAAAEPDTAKKLMMELELNSAGKEIVNAADYLLSLPETSTKHVGVVGFCMGGSLAIWSGTLSPMISATVGFSSSRIDFIDSSLCVCFKGVFLTGSCDFLTDGLFVSSSAFNGDLKNPS